VAAIKRRPEPPEAPATVDVVIDSLPAGAEVVRNGSVIGKTPYRGTLPRSSRDVQLVLRLRGYAPKPITVDTGAASKQHVKLVPVVHNQSVNPF
jgi:hypothetical protein